MAAFFQN